MTERDDDKGADWMYLSILAFVSFAPGVALIILTVLNWGK